MAVTRDHRPWEGEGNYGWWEQVESLWDGTPQFEWRPPHRGELLDPGYLLQLKRTLNRELALLQWGGGREHPEHPK